MSNPMSPTIAPFTENTIDYITSAKRVRILLILRARLSNGSSQHDVIRYESCVLYPTNVYPADLNFRVCSTV